MATLNAASLSSQIGTTLTTTVAEDILDAAINRIVLYLKFKSLRNLGGTAGTKSLTCTQAEHGGIVAVAVAIYARDYISSGANSSSMGLGGVSLSQSTAQSGVSSVDDLAMQVARQLEENDWSRAII
jgi:hypothetical protein